MGGYSRVALVVGAAVAVFLQIVLAPVVSIGNAVPNFVVAYVAATSVARPRDTGLVMPFALGLAYDLVGNAPVGAMALLCVVAAYALSHLMAALDNDTSFMPLVLLVAGVFIVDILYALLVAACGMEVNLLDSILYRSLPCGLYDAVLGLVAFPLVLRFVMRGAAPQSMSGGLG